MLSLSGPSDLGEACRIQPQASTAEAGQVSSALTALVSRFIY